MLKGMPLYKKHIDALEEWWFQGLEKADVKLRFYYGNTLILSQA